MERFRASFAGLADPRRGNARRHELLEILLIALLATLCGAETCVDMARFGRAKEDLLRQLLRLPGGIPSHDTFSRLFRILDPEALEACFAGFVASLAGRAAGVVAIDGKTSRRSFDRQAGQGPLHLVSAWACEQRLVLGQRKVDGASNEIEAVPELLKLLDIEGCTITADAMHCQKGTAAAILARGADYVLAVKANQPSLHEDVRLLLDDPSTSSDGRTSTTDGDHGRIETREAVVVHDVGYLVEAHAWPGLQAVGKVTATREIDGKISRSTRYYILSKKLSAERFLEIARGHWGIENRLHWVLDVVMGEDQSRSRKDHAPENLTRLRRFALNLVRADKSKGSARGKIKQAAWNDKFLLEILKNA
jgi:predicted transposase YbfD/YdcC